MSQQHQFLGIDEGGQRLHWRDTAALAPRWTLDLQGWPLARDLQKIGPDRALVGYDRGCFELQISDGQILRDYSAWTQVTAAHRRADGHTLLTGIDLDGPGRGVQVLTLDADGQVIHVARRDGDYVRLMRVTDSGSYLLSVNDHIVETDTELRTLREFRAEGFEHAWMAQRMADGTTLVSAGYGAFMARFDAQARLMASFGHAADLPAEVAPHFYASFQLLGNGQLLVANWAGHGEDNGGTGHQLLEFDPSGRFRGSWSDAQKISSLQGILMLPVSECASALPIEAVQHTRRQTTC